MIYESMGIEELQRRYSRIIYLLKQANRITQGEAVTCLISHFRDDPWAGIAVNLSGGVEKCLNRAMRMRKVIHGYPRKARIKLLSEDLAKSVLQSSKPSVTKD